MKLGIFSRLGHRADAKITLRLLRRLHLKTFYQLYTDLCLQLLSKILVTAAWKDHQYRTVGVHCEHVAIRRNVLSGQLSPFPCIRSPCKTHHMKYLSSAALYSDGPSSCGPYILTLSSTITWSVARSRKIRLWNLFRLTTLDQRSRLGTFIIKVHQARADIVDYWGPVCVHFY